MLSIAGRGGIETTVDQTLMRGLVTAGPVFVLGLSLSQSRGLVPPNQIESCPDLPPRPPLCNGILALFLSRLPLCLLGCNRPMLPR